MAENLDDDEFWLSPQFLADDDVVVFPIPFEAKFSPLSNNAVLFPYSSPVDSTVGGSSETESNEEEQLVAELTRHLTRSSLQPDTEAVGQFVSGSPQSTLCAFGSECSYGKGSSHGSPDGVCKLSSVKTTWDLLHAATGEVERMRLKQEGVSPLALATPAPAALHA
ncbi:hypothetical protein AAZX31_03G105600 [Glycine max]|uniref:Uncharacterized protein n=1 Tax=Glycine soja TaxID=3848 RepID=A0A0B2S3N3_GLYSO|nr:hypothetical protein JHK85_007479 [Glycine max]KAG5072056.1 hypothetical protein JHK86_007267 [Glycine max]KAH1257890.1 hypothetical protein GmHk_03G007760 [Glycine max]KHN38802.1 hypothetical protein glysoja_040190 [Glycine soja]